MRFKRSTVVFSAMIALMLLTTSAALAVNEKFSQISHNTAIDSDPQVDGDNIVWSGYEDGDSEIYLYQISTGSTTQVSINTAWDSDPQVDGDNVVWVGQPEGDAEIYLYQISTGSTTNVSDNISSDGNPHISGDSIAWVGYDGDEEIFLYQISTGSTTQVTFNTAIDYNVQVDGDYIVWRGEGDGDPDIYLYQISTGSTTNVSNNTAADYYPEIVGDSLVWAGDGNGDWEIYHYQISTGSTTNISNDTAYDELPQVDGDNIVWQKYVDGDWEIYHYQISTGSTTNVSNNTAEDRNPQVAGDAVVWMGDADGDNDIYLFQISTGITTLLRNNTANDENPQVDGDTIVWVGEVDGDKEIYRAEIGGLHFSDDFETNNFSRWTRFNDGNGYLYPCTDAGINGTYGACVDRGTDKRKQLIDETPVNQIQYNARFNLDLNSLTMDEGTRFRFVQVKMGAERPFFITLKYETGGYWIQLNTLKDDLTKAKTGWYPLSDAPHVIEIAWVAASAPAADDGSAAFYLDGALLEAKTGLDNDEIFVDTFKIGFTSRLNGKPISGIFYLDDIATSNNGYIGLP